MSTESNESHPRIDFNSPDWHRIVEFLTDEMNDSVGILLGNDVLERKADFHRGRIHQIRQILDWAPQASR